MKKDIVCPRCKTGNLHITGRCEWCYSVVPFRDFPEDSRILEMRKMLIECADMLSEVRTGEDFEVQCWSLAEKARKMAKES